MGEGVAGTLLVLTLRPFIMGVLFDYHLYICLSRNPAVWHLESRHPSPCSGACTPHFSWVSGLPVVWRYAVWLGCFWLFSFCLWSLPWQPLDLVFLVSPLQHFCFSHPWGPWTWRSVDRAGTLDVLPLMGQVTQLPRPAGRSWRQKAGL